MGKLVFVGEEAEKKKKMMIIGAVLLLVIILFAVALLWRSHQPNERDGGQRRTPEVASVKVPATRENGGAAATFLVKPSPTDLLAAIATVNKAELPVNLTQYEKARVLWPVYFFRIRKMDGKTAVVMFDSGADGFGAAVRAEIDLTATQAGAATFSEIKRMRSGQRVWLAGEIIGVDTTGTGSIRLKADYCNANGDLSLEEITRDMAAHFQH